MNKLLVILPALLLFTINSISQQRFSVSASGGYTMPVADLRGNFPDTLGTGIDFYKAKTLLTTSGFNLGLQGKYAVDSLGSQKIIAGLNYNSFSGSMDYSRPNFGTQTYTNKVSIVSLSAGIEYAINPSKKFVPFISLEFAANFYSGKVEGSGDTLFVVSRKSENRFGVIATGGVDIKLWSSGGLIAGVKYALTNLIGKSSEITTSNINTPIYDIEPEGGSEGSEIPLNDKEVSGSPEKILNYVQFFVGISYNFGEKLGKRK
jgi:hypothetical protein